MNDTGLFSRVNYKFDGQQVTFQLLPEPGLLAASFDNFAWIDVSQIDARLRAKIPLYKGSVAVGSGLEQQVIAELTALAVEQHLNASVTAVPLLDLKTGKTTGDNFRLTTPSVVVTELTFEGASPDQLKNLDTVVKGAVGQDYSITASPEAVSSAIMNVYRNQGFLDVDVSKISNLAPTLTPDRIAVPMKATIVEGGQYHLGKWTLAGSMLMTQDDFAKTAPLKPGDVANQQLLRRSLQYLASPYKNKGYLRAKISATPAADPSTHLVDYAISVTPGEQFHLGKVELSNLSEAQRAKFFSVWKMQPGDPYDESYAIGFLKKNSAGLNEFASMSATYKTYEHEDSHTVDLAVNFEKAAVSN